MGSSSLFLLMSCIELLLPSRNFLSHSLPEKSKYVFTSESSDTGISFHFILNNLYISSPAQENKKCHLHIFSFKYHLAMVAEANSEMSATPLWLYGKIFCTLFLRMGSINDFFWHFLCPSTLCFSTAIRCLCTHTHGPLSKELCLCLMRHTET